eukprot:60811-Chlamydomonas_euryale.AAC.5
MFAQVRTGSGQHGRRILRERTSPGRNFLVQTRPQSAHALWALDRGTRTFLQLSGCDFCHFNSDVAARERGDLWRMWRAAAQHPPAQLATRVTFPACVCQQQQQLAQIAVEGSSAASEPFLHKSRSCNGKWLLLCSIFMGDRETPWRWAHLHGRFPEDASAFLVGAKA